MFGINKNKKNQIDVRIKTAIESGRAVMLTEENERKSYQQLFDEFPNEVYFINTEFKIERANLCALSTHKTKKLVGNYCYEVNECRNGDLICSPCPIARSFKSKHIESEVFELFNISDNKFDFDTGVYMEKMAIPTFDEEGQLMGAFLHTRDVTEKVLFKRLKNLYFKSDKVDTLNDKFTDADLINKMSYELKSSLDNIVGMSQLLENSELTREQFDWLESIRTSTKKLNNVLSNVVDASNYGNEQIVVNQVNFNLQKEIKKYQMKFEREINDKKVRLIYKFDSRIPQNLIGDIEKMLKIVDSIVHFIYNKINRGKITLKTELLSQTSESVDIKITIFNRSQWASEDNAATEDIGVAMSKNLLEMLNGKYKVKTNGNEGNVLELTLNLKKDQKDKADVSTKSFWNREVFGKKVDGIQSKPKILIAEDETIGRITLEHMLKNKYDLIFAEDGRTAVNMYFKEEPDLVIMDIMMPDMNGFEAYDEIDKNSIERAPMIACTAKVISSEREYLTSYGFDDYIPKPVDLKLLLSVINKHLDK